jgi:hypothetical protein
MDKIEEIFDKMDYWRNLPKYELERRSDLFFALYLKDVIAAKFKPIKEQVIPEFPIHKATIKPFFDGALSCDGEESCNVDFVAFAQDNSECYFVELKTDNASERDKQDKYLAAAKKAKLKLLIQNLTNKIFLATKEKRKYFQLFKLLEDAGIVNLPTNLQTKLFSPHPQGSSDLIRQIKDVCQIDPINIVYILPNDTTKLKKNDNVVITFDEFSNIISKYTDPVTTRFRQSLQTWSKTKAGNQS